MVRRWQWEEDIQRVAIERLAKRYADRHPDARICYRAEVRTRVARGRAGRADGLIAIRFGDGTIHTVSIEAKSVRTKGALLGKQGCGAIFAGTIAIWALIGVAIGRQSVSRLGAVLGFSVAVVVGLAIGLLFLRWATYSPRFIEHAVLNQVRSYPAGEHWIAVTKDFTIRHAGAVKDLLAACRNAGVGVVVIGRRGQFDVLHDIRPKAHRDTLDRYRIETTIRASLGRAKPGFPLQIER